VHGSSIAVFTLGKHLNTLSFTITYTQDMTTASATGAGWANRLPRFSVESRAGLTKKIKVGQISAPQDGRPLNSDSMREGGPISLSAIGRPDVNVDTAPEAARRREERRHVIENVRGDDLDEEMIEEKISQGHEAWREGDNIIIEDEDGEVIRTITSPEQHHDLAGDKFGRTAKDKLSKVESKAEEEIGGVTSRLKRLWSGGSRKEPEKAERPRDLEKGIPEDENETVVVETITSASSQRSHTSIKDPLKNSPPNLPSRPSFTAFIVDEDNRRMGHVSERTERRAREEREEETEVERRRREAVLGISHDSDSNQRPAISRNKGKQPESSSSDDDDDDTDDNPPSHRRSPSSSVRAESSGSGSGSGAPLVSQPFRAREIRFGDISVGQESFSLDSGPPSSGARHHKTGSGSGDWRVRWSNK
jgi:hypothetical protein